MYETVEALIQELDTKPLAPVEQLSQEELVALAGRHPIHLLQAGEAYKSQPGQITGSYGATTGLNLLLTQGNNRLLIQATADFSLNLVDLLRKAEFNPREEICLIAKGAASLSPREIPKDYRKEYCGLELLRTNLNAAEAANFRISITHACVLEKAVRGAESGPDIFVLPDGRILNSTLLRLPLLNNMRQQPNTLFIERELLRNASELLGLLMRAKVGEQPIEYQKPATSLITRQQRLEISIPKVVLYFWHLLTAQNKDKSYIKSYAMQMSQVRAVQADVCGQMLRLFKKCKELCPPNIGTQLTEDEKAMTQHRIWVDQQEMAGPAA